MDVLMPSINKIALDTNPSDALILPNGPHVIRNDRQTECRHCGKVHETLTHNCRPVVFTDPSRMEAHVRKVTRTDRHVDTLITSLSVGTPLAISAQEAHRLDPLYRTRPFNR